MSLPPTLAKILERSDVWRGNTLASALLPGVPTGFSGLDRELPGGGWPRGALTELLPARRGVGELSLLLPALVRLSKDELAWIVCVAPPYPLYAPALDESGVDLSRLLIASAPGRDAAWACERSLRAEGVGAVIAWLPEVSADSLRRLQLAAEASASLLFVFRPPTCALQPSPAPLRLALEGGGGGLIVHLLKRRGGTQPLPLPIVIPRPAVLKSSAETVANRAAFPA
ncbi:translesion DNA synthesis-associated protein ImuA [Accumulibacter sp.]|uniref:translesion DNA synthesis-associated protein ImuA n=1 Tax=Accumulibacter sp. TaxID=2053492 RepID=UPI0025E97498|nr:translesion DNA synthesis-associated protein ImuA [Accumulibacter sp.]MCM8595050.1 translesion DNA synthesis-associated protein ImuA [Accumulibacter sp.]MCM8625433.1 translesion DNA synthesis-associated protein ImuA [Accumulibacter sp.]MDS4049196.1 translesion DNA synthesis-associated protein ImuA [Accumulibacter sp.]